MSSSGELILIFVTSEVKWRISDTFIWNSLEWLRLPRGHCTFTSDLQAQVPLPPPLPPPPSPLQVLIFLSFNIRLWINAAHVFAS